MTKTVFITSFHPLISRNIISTSLLEQLLGIGNTRLVIAVPEKKRTFFEEEFGRPSLIVEGVSRTTSRREFFLRYLALAALNTRSLAIKRKTELHGSGAWLTRLIGNRQWARWAIRQLDRWLSPRGRFGELLDRYRPSVVLSTDVQNENDVRLIHEARDRNIPTVGMVRSWDNLTSKGLIRAVPDLLVVNNEVVKSEATSLHGISALLVRVVGIPHYDRYDGPVHPRDVFAQKFGLNRHKRYVLYTPTGDRYLTENRMDEEVISYLASVLPPTHELLIRLPPADTVTFANSAVPPNVVMYRPGRQLSRDSKLFRLNELTLEDDEWLRDTLAYVDVVVTGPSTMVIDAAVFDRPIILVGFDGASAHMYYQSVRCYYDYDHWGPVFASGGVRLARSAGELSEWLRRYLSDPTLGREGRKRIVAEECGKLDGRSSQRLGEVLVESITRVN